MFKKCFQEIESFSSFIQPCYYWADKYLTIEMMEVAEAAAEAARNLTSSFPHANEREKERNSDSLNVRDDVCFFYIFKL